MLFSSYAALVVTVLELLPHRDRSRLPDEYPERWTDLSRVWCRPDAECVGRTNKVRKNNENRRLFLPFRVRDVI